MRRYDIRDIAKRVVNAFLHFKLENKLQISDREAFDLLSYSVKSMYGMECEEYSDTTCEYGYSCSQMLKKTRGVPKRLSLEDKTHLLDLIRGYFLSKTV